MKNRSICLFYFLVICHALFGSSSDVWDGEQYRNHSELQTHWAQNYVEKLGLRGDETILDIGCGDGRITALLAYAVPNGKVIGADNSESMLAMAYRLKEELALPNLQFANQNAISLHFEETFDRIVSFSCFHWLSDPLSALQGIQQILKPDGQVFLYFAPDHGRNRFDHSIDAVVQSSQWKEYFAHFANSFYLVTPAQFAMYAEKSGLLFHRMEIITVDEVFSTREGFISWIKAWMPHLKVLPEEKHEKFLCEIIDHYLSIHPIDGDGNIHFIDYWMEVELLG